MEKVLVISSNEKNSEIIINMLKPANFRAISTVYSVGEARRAVSNNNYDLFIINSPVQNDSGVELAKELVNIGTSQVIFIVKNDAFDYISAKVEEFGVVTISKPLNKVALISAIKILKAVSARLLKIQTQNAKLSQKIDDIRIIDRAKCVLISHFGMDESEAHKYIEKNAMDMRKSRREVAEKILTTYEN